MGNGQGKRLGSSGSGTGASEADVAELVAKFSADPQVKRLDLRSKNLDQVPPEITQLQALTWLNLPNNNLIELPDHLCELTALQTLRLLGNRLTTLPLSVSKLVALSSLDLSKNDFIEINDNIGLLTSLTDLNLHWNIIEQISPQLSNLTKLKTLNASLNALASLPALPKCSQLETLDASHNRLHDVPVACKDMPKLSSLNLAGNRLMHLTGPILAGMPSLRTLDLQGNELKSLPVEICSLTQLKYLRLRSNLLTELPSAITQLTNLVELGASQNFLMSLPRGLGALTQLVTLHVYHNSLDSLPDDLGSLTAVRELGIAWNNITALPASLGQFSQLAMLFANHNKLVRIPDAVFAGLGKLQELTLNNNALDEIPDNLSAMTDLRKLDLSTNRLTRIPDTSTMPQLAWLELANNLLSKIPLSLCATTVLTSLNLFANKLVSVPPEIKQLMQLKKLYLGYNALDESSMPPADSWRALTSLEELFLSGNKFRAIPAQLRELTSLTELDFSNNSLSNLEGPIIGSFKSLKHLHLTCNQLTGVPDAIGLLSNLAELDLAHNSLVSLPDTFGQLTALTDLDVSDNSLESLPSSFEQTCSDMRQFKGGYNRFRRVPVFEMSKSLPADHLWISISGNERVPIAATDPSRRAAFPTRTTNANSSRAHRSEEERGSDWSQSESAAQLGGSRQRSNTETSGAEDISSDSLDRAAFHLRRSVGWAEMCGRRPDMQDTLCVHLSYRGNSQRSLVGLFDGHSGEKSAELVCNMLHGVVAKRLQAAEQGIVLQDDAEAEAKKQRELENRPKIRRGKARDLTFESDDEDADGGESKPKGKGKDKDLKGRSEKERNAALHGEPVRRSKTGGSTEDATKPPSIPGGNKPNGGSGKGATTVTSKLKDMPDPNKPLPEAVMIRVLTGTFRELHGAITKRRITDGTAALVMIVEHDHRRLVIANSGDERAVLSRAGHAVQITTDHKPEEPSEKVRVYDCGGFVNEQKRVDGILSLSRALGDNDLQPHVTYEPEVYTVELGKDDAFVILACDGLWDVVTSEQAVAIASLYSSPAEAATALRDHAHMLGSTDNISVIVYRLDQEPSTSPSSSSTGVPLNDHGKGKGKDRDKDREKEKRHSKRGSDLESGTPSKSASKRATKLLAPDDSSPKKHARRGSGGSSGGSTHTKLGHQGEKKD